MKCKCGHGISYHRLPTEECPDPPCNKCACEAFHEDLHEAEQKIESIEKQMRACEKGTQHHIDCPYCQGRNERGALVCCMTFAKAARAIIERWTTKAMVERAEVLAEAIDHATRN